MSFVNVTVSAVSKGRVPTTLTIHELGGIVPSLGWARPQIEDADPTPLLLPGESVVLLVVPDETGIGGYVPEGYTGEYWVSATGMAGRSVFASEPTAGSRFTRHSSPRRIGVNTVSDDSVP